MVIMLKHKLSQSMVQKLSESVLILTLFLLSTTSFLASNTCEASILGKPSSAFRSNSKQNSFFRFTRTKNSNSIKNEPESRDGYVRIKEKPEPEIITGLGSSHVLSCEAQGTPSPKIHWLKDGQKIPQSIDDLIKTDEYSKTTDGLGLSITGSKLFLDCLTPKDSGEYTCVAETPYRRSVAHSRVKVLPESQIPANSKIDSICLNREPSGLDVPARIYMFTTTTLELIGSTAQLYCRAEGLPRPSIKWFGPDETAITVDSRFQVSPTGDLLIRKVTWNDMGSYTCVTANSNGQDKVEIFLYPTKPDER